MASSACIVCGSDGAVKMFSKNSGRGESFILVKCRECGLQFLHPRPSEEEIKQYYGSGYFTQRTERGYDNYFSSRIRDEIRRVIELNMGDLGFFKFERSVKGVKKCLDIGCAAGYFVEYMKDRGWISRGIDVSSHCAAFAMKELGLDVMEGNYLNTGFAERFNLVTLWATIEHLHHPDRVIAKIHHDLQDGGRLYISTCRSGGMNFMRLYGENWRYYNFPEHLFFFSHSNLKRLLEQKGFKVKNYATYGSGFGKGGTSVRRIADFMAKRFGMGDMMILEAEKMQAG